MVAVAQLVEHRIVIPSVAGSSPVSHPNFIHTEPLILGNTRPGLGRRGTKGKGSTHSMVELYQNHIILKDLAAEVCS